MQATSMLVHKHQFSCFLWLLIIAFGSMVVVLPAQPANASTQRVILAELFTATWCTNCPYATEAINNLKNDYGSKLVVLQYHPSENDPIGNTDSDARILYYDINGFPTMIFDGKNQVLGGSDITYDSYKTQISVDLLKTSDVSLSAKGTLSDFDVKVVVSNNLPTMFVGLNFVVFEDNISYAAQNGENLFRYSVRAVLPSQEIVLNAGQTTTIHKSFQPQSNWDNTNLGLAVFIQSSNTNEVLQSAILTEPTPSFSVYPLFSSTSIKTEPNKINEFNIKITNTGSIDDSYNLTLSKNLPTGWSAGFCTNGVCYWDTAIIQIAAGSSVTINAYEVANQTLGSGRATLDVFSQTDKTIVQSIDIPEITLASMPSQTSQVPEPTPTVPEFSAFALFLMILPVFAIIIFKTIIKNKKGCV
jgi:thiol-disulfide isomerase/thioredoxin